MIVGRAKPVKVAPGHEICAQGDPADCIWLLHEGIESHPSTKPFLCVLTPSFCLSFQHQPCLDTRFPTLSLITKVLLLVLIPRFYLLTSTPNLHCVF